MIRDLLSGRKRFTDLMDRLGGITPKTLSQRLRELDDAGIVSADREAGRREVWYELTQMGEELEPVVAALGGWGLRHAWRNPHPGELLHPEHLLRAVIQAIDIESTDRAAAQWHFVLSGEDYLASSDGKRWSYSMDRPSTPSELTFTASGAAFSNYIFSGSDDGVSIEGAPDALDRFQHLIGTVATVIGRAN